MTTSIRLLIHSTIWLIIWLLLWFDQGNNLPFLKDNSPLFITQLLIMAGLIYILAPKFLFNKKYILFFGISFITIGVLAWITANFPDAPLRPHIRRGDGPPVRPPSRFFIHYLLILLAYLIATFVETFMFAQRKQEEVVLSKNENLQTELKLLKSQINPHFLFNALNNIYALSAIDASKTQQSISHLSNMLRYVLYECDKPLVALEKEIDYIENYITLFSLKSSTPYNISKQFNVALKQQPIAPMLLIPFIENTFKHSGIEKRQGAFIHMELNATRNEIVFKIKNSYDPNAKAMDALGGIGLDNVKKRLQIVYPNAHDLHISTIDQTFSVTLNIRFNESH